MKNFLNLKVLKFFFTLFSVLLLTAEVSVFLLIFYHVKEFPVFLPFLCISLILFTSLILFLFFLFIKKILKKNTLVNKSDLSSLYESLNSLLSIFNFYNEKFTIISEGVFAEKKNMSGVNFEQIIKLGNFFNDRIELIKTEKFVFGKKEYHDFSENIKELHDVSVDFIKLNNEHVLKATEEIKDAVSISKVALEGMAKFFYNLVTSTEILSELSSSANSFSLKMMKQIFEKFDAVSDFSQNIYKDTQETILNFMESGKNDTLGFVLIESRKIKSKLDQFYTTMTQLKIISDNFLENSISSLHELGKTASVIEDISEKIKVIAINVRIEAARTSGDSGFKVLGKEITEFANLTAKSAQDSYKRIQETTEAIETLKNQYVGEFNNVYESLSGIQRSFVSFEEIINNSFNKIRSVVGNMDDYSNSINKKIKETVGMLQYHDLSTQEFEHIIKYIEHVAKVFFSLTEDLPHSEVITKSEKDEILKEILLKLDALITTDNERKIIERKALELGIKLNSSQELKNIKKIDEQTILF